jgi:transposase
MGKKRKSYTREFKLDAVRLAKESGRVPTYVARELGITPSMMSRWIKEFEEHGEDAFLGRPEPNMAGCEEITAAEKIRRLEREVADLREEREILKKAAAYFAKHQS